MNKSNTDTYFKIFQIKKISDIDSKELIRRFRILVKKYHPDMKPHGNEEKFKLIYNAYKYLTDQMDEFIKIENQKFYNNDFLYYGDGSIFSISKKRWVKLKGKIINVKG